MMNTLPLFFNLNQKNVLIVGGGYVAYRKAILLAKSGARLIVLSSDINPNLKGFLNQNQHVFVKKNYQEGDLIDLSKSYHLAFVICATDDLELNRLVYHETKSIGLSVNVVDTPELCDFIFPAIVDRDLITIGVSSVKHLFWQG